MNNLRKTPEHTVKNAQFARTPVTYVYAFAMGEFCKIGITKNLDERLKQYRVHSPLPLVEGYTQEVRPDQARTLERAVHVALAKYRTHGEWFRVTCKKAERAIVAARKELGITRYVHPTPQ